MDKLTLEIQRNRTAEFEIELLDSEGNLIILTASDKIVFGVKKDESQQVYAIYKELTIADINADETAYSMVLSYSDTNISAGYYHYDISLHTTTGEYGVIEYGDFVVKRAIVERC